MRCPTTSYVYILTRIQKERKLQKSGNVTYFERKGQNKNEVGIECELCYTVRKQTKDRMRKGRHIYEANPDWY